MDNQPHEEQKQNEHQTPDPNQDNRYDALIPPQKQEIKKRKVTISQIESDIDDSIASEDESNFQNRSISSVSKSMNPSRLPSTGSRLKKNWTIKEDQISEITELDMSLENNTNASLPDTHRMKTGRFDKSQSYAKKLTERKAQLNQQNTKRNPECETDNASSSFVYSEAPVRKSKYVTFRHGKYELIKLIGQGMTSKVFMIRLSKDHNQVFALKVIVNSYFERRQEYILNEVKVLQSFKSNPHIISLVEYGRASFLDNQGEEWG